MYLLFDINELHHLKCVNHIFQYEYDLPVRLQNYFVKNLVAINAANKSGNEYLFDYTEFINYCIENEVRPAAILVNLTQFPCRDLRVHQIDLHTITVEETNKLIAENIAAIAKLNQYFIDYYLIAQIKLL